MQRVPKFALVSVALGLVVAAGWWSARPEPVEVRVHDVGLGTVEAVVSNTRAGEVEACQRTRLATIQGGRIDYLGVKEGDRVEAGQVLLRLWNGDQQARLAVSRAQWATARQRRGEACTLAAQAAREASRQEALFARGFVSVSRLEQARSESVARAAACASVEAEVLTAAAQVRASEVEESRSVIVAPFAGTVAKIVGDLGEYSTPSPPGVPTPPAIELLDDGCLYVKAPMDEVDAPRIRPGQPVRVRVDALPGKVFEATVRRVAPFVSAQEKQARTVDIEVDFRSQDAVRGLLVGYSADAEVVLEVAEAVLRVPVSALRDGNRVLVFDPASGRLQARRLELGLANWEYAEVRQGLAAGEQVVTSLERAGVADGVPARLEAAATRP